jgi:hypothetical protein
MGVRERLSLRTLCTLPTNQAGESHLLLTHSMYSWLATYRLAFATWSVFTQLVYTIKTRGQQQVNGRPHRLFVSVDSTTERERS